MATSRGSSAGTRRLAWAVAFLALGVIAGCGNQTSVGRRVHEPVGFGWLQPSRQPSTWRTARLPDRTARLAYPPAWRAIRTDPGTATVARTAADGAILGYLNVTPRQGDETLSNWARFRINHSREEGSRDVRLLHASTRLAFRYGHGSCVEDEYRNAATGYREIACIVSGARATTVIVGAAPVDQWPAQAPEIKASIAAFAT